MKSIKNMLAVLALAVLFATSFIMGRVTAVRSSQERIAAEAAEAERTVAILPLLKGAQTPVKTEAPEKNEETQEVHSAKPGEEVEEEKEEPPSNLPYPVSGSVSLGYSLQSVYSETMKDWRAHQGIDIEAPLAAAVTVPADGRVERVYQDKLWGNVIEIQHKGGLKTIYKGVSTLDMVDAGETVAAGTVISGVGISPSESKAQPHLHFETWQDGVCVNPECYVSP